MKLAIREMRRSMARFTMLTGALALLVFLVLFQQSLQNGLVTSFVGAIRNQSAPVLVYSVDARRVVQGSTITPELAERVEAAPGVAEVASLGQGTFVVDTGDELVDAAVIGYTDAELGGPARLVGGRMPSSLGEVIGADADASIGFGLGDVVRLGTLELTVVGLAADVQLNAGPTLFGSYDTYLAAVVAANPDARPPEPNVLAVRPADGVSPEQLVASINAASDELDALTRDDAAEGTPGVAQVRNSFRIVFALYALVVPCVTGLFFLIVTLQKAGALTLLRAIGAPGWRLAAAGVVQASLVIGAALALAIAAYYPVSQRRLGSITLRFETSAVIWWSVAIGVLGVGSSLLAARRVLAIDPADATRGQR